MELKQRKLTIGYLAIALIAILVFQLPLFGPRAAHVSYSEFKALAKKGKVSNLTLDKETISGTLSADGLEPLLSWVLPAVVFAGVWVLMRRFGPQQGLMTIGKSKARVYVEHKTGVTFDDVAGIDEARGELMEVVDFLKNPDRYRRLGGKIPKGVLIVGAPGTGKTLLAKAVAGEAGVPFFSLSGSDFVEMFVGVGAARLRDLFAQAQEKAPSIIFIDELDALGKARGVSPIVGGHDEREQTLNQLLAEMDGFDTQKGVMILAATNRPEILDPALLRPGRFDRQVAIDRPDRQGRAKILKVHTHQVTLSPEIDLARIAASTPGFVGADLANLVNEAALRAAREGKDAVEMSDFEASIDRVVAGLERKSRVINPQEKTIVAYHEAGHALVAEARPHADRVAKISIIPRGIAALGYTQQQPTEDRYLMTRAELLDRLDVLLGGRVAEELIFGEVSTSAQDDLRRATDIARHMITRYGMSEALGLATFEAPRQALFLQVPTGAAKEYSEETARVIDTEIQQLLEAAHLRVRATLTAKRALLEALGKMLITHEVVDRRALTQLLETAVTAEIPYVPAGPDRAADTVRAVKPRATSSSNGGHAQAGDAWE